MATAAGTPPGAATLAEREELASSRSSTCLRDFTGGDTGAPVPFPCEEHTALQESSPDLEEVLARARNTEAALHAERERTAQYLDTIGVMLVIVNAGEKTTLINRKGREILGYDEADLIGRNWFDTVVPRKRRDERRNAFHRLLAGAKGAQNDGPDSVVTSDGETRIVDFRHTLVRDPDGRPTGVLMSGEDVTELQKTRELLQHSQLLASLGEMTAGIAHQVNNPLGSILLYSELMAALDLPPEIKRDLKIIHEEARRATKVMTDLLSYTRREKASPRRLNLHTILSKVLDMRRYTQGVQNIKTTAGFCAAPLHVKGDPTQLMQVFMNLVFNAEGALKEAGGGNIYVSTAREGSWAKVSVAGDGESVAPEDLAHVFYPFFGKRWAEDGSGLGLCTCYGIVTDHGGLIRAENNGVGGTTFAVELPLVEAPAGARPRHSTRRTGKTG